jgi:hypothetical protein
MACFAALVALLFPAVSAQAQGDRDEDEVSEPAWIPSIETGVEGSRYDIETTIVNLTDPTSRSGSQTAKVNQLVFRIGGELMGPMFENLYGRPRLFVQGGAGFNTFAGERVFKIDTPDIDLEPESGFDRYEVNGPGERDLPFDFEGQGSWLDVDFQDPSWYAGLGLAFGVPATDGVLFYIKPSVQYSMEEIDFKGKLKTVYEPPPTGIDPPDGPFTRTFEVRESNAKFSTTDHLVGPGLEVAMAFSPVGPIQFSLFGQARFLFLISDDTTSFTDPNGFAAYSVTRDNFVIKGGVGVRLGWVGWGAGD